MYRRTHAGRSGVIVLATSLFALASCDDGDGNVTSLDAPVRAPASNPITDEKAALGKLLFFDPILSTNGDVACATCHIPEFGYSDGLALTIGVGGSGLGPDRLPGVEFPHAGRNSQGLVNVAFNGLLANDDALDPRSAPMFWDHRTFGLEVQVLEPIASAAEMRGSTVLEEEAIPRALERLRDIDEYVDLFDEAFGDGAITETRLSHALSTFLRTLVARNSPFDRYMRGDQGALTQQQQRGMDVFLEAECAECHSGPMLSDWGPRSLGVAPHPDRVGTDDGAGLFHFRSASLRNVELTAPYMHNGMLATLEDVIDFYSDGNSQHPGVPINDIAPQNFSDGERRDLIAFLESLTDTSFDQTVPDSVPSGLPVPGASAGLLAMEGGR